MNTPFLRLALTADAVASIGLGGLMIAAAGFIASLTGLPSALLFWAGVGRAVVCSLQGGDGSGFGPARAGDSAVVLGLLIIVLFSAHSLVDYPLRRLATLALFVIAVGCVFRERR